MSIFSSLTSEFGLEEFKDDASKKFSYGIFANGLFCKRNEPVGVFVTQEQKFDGKKFNLTKECELSFTSNLPKIPATILLNVIKFFQDIQTKFSSEVYISIYWDKVKKDYFLFVPKQEVSGAAVNFENDYEMLNNPNIFIVADIHSHSSFGAFFSSTDIKDEVASRLFGVIGKVNTDNPELVFRASSNKQSIDLQINDIFDGTVDSLQDDSDYSINTEEQLTKITEIRIKNTYPIIKKGNAYNPNIIYADSYLEDYDQAYPYYDYGTKNTVNPIRKAVKNNKHSYSKNLYYTGTNNNAFQYFSEKFRSFLNIYSPSLIGATPNILKKEDTVSSLFYSLAALVFEEINYNSNKVSATKEDIDCIISSIIPQLDLAADEYFDSPDEVEFNTISLN